jgi:CheY-like chemotaxis protein/HPt (histidine-containing phosphotransfer) domain-containing protein
VARVVATSGTDQTVELSVTDTGAGLTDEQQSRLFAEFAQAEGATAQRFGGTGLGLVICRRLAVLMGGDVTLESRVGKGTTIRLVVPLPVADPADVVLTPPAAPALRPRPSRADAEREGSLLLLVDDHPVNRTVLRHQLNSAGFEVDLARDGAEAFELYVDGCYGLVLTDVTMPVMNGYELASAIRAHERETGRARTPIIALSANVMQGEPERCRAAGMDDFAGKPTTIPFIAEKLRRWLPDLVWQPETAAADDAPIDADWLAQLTGGDLELATTLLGDFIESTRNDLAALHESVVARDPEQIRRHAHRMKGASRTVGAHPLTEISQQLEHLAVHGVGDWDRLRALVTEAGAQLGAFEHSSAAQTQRLKVKASALTGSKVVP